MKCRSVLHRMKEIVFLPFYAGMFSPLKVVVRPSIGIGLMLLSSSNAMAAYGSGIDASTGFGYIQWIIMAIGLIFTLIMAISCGFAFRNDAANAKAQLIGTIMIPVLFAVIIYIFNKTLGVSLTSNSSL